MKRDNLPSSRCSKCGTIMEWKIVKNVAWAKYPKRRQLYCPTCKKMRKGSLSLP